MPRVVVKHKVRWNGDYGGVEGKGGVNGGVGGRVMGPTGGLSGSIGLAGKVLMSEGEAKVCGMVTGGFMADGWG